MTLPGVLDSAIFAIGIGQWGVLVASSLIPSQLNWQETLAGLPRLVRQLFWVYGGYVVLSIIGLGAVCLLHHAELAAGGGLARAVCVYGAVFWGVRLGLQAVLDAGPHLKTWWLRCGYHLLTVLFTSFTAVYLWAAFADR